MKPAAIVVMMFLFVVAFLHFLRVLLSIEITVNGLIIPVWMSVLACLGPGALAVWLWREERASSSQES
jgi:hypothetical protein